MRRLLGLAAAACLIMGSIGPAAAVEAPASHQADRLISGTIDEWPPEADRWTEVTFELFTVDRIYLNKYGGITAEGRIACEPLGEEEPADGWILAGIWWTALQYVGRKTALTASATMARAVPCWQSGVTGPTPWITSLRITPQDGVQWVYSEQGKFGSGSIYIDAQANAGYQVITQHFDPSGGTAPYDPACLDENGDGYCVDEVFYNSLFQANMKPIRVR